MAVKESQRTAFHEALRLLLTRRFILRETDPEDYFLIRRLERPLKEYFEGRCGWTFYIHAKFFKLEKIPEQPRAYSGIESMQGPEDYALLCTVFAFLEEQDVGGQFLLSQMLEVLPGLYPETAPLPLSWESYTMRRALIRVMRALEQEQVIQVVEDESADFLKKDFSAGNPQGEALYEVTVLARYFLRHFPKGIRQYETAADFAAADFEPAPGDMERDEEKRRHCRWRVYRGLLLDPAFYREGHEAEFLYLRNKHKVIENEMDEDFDLSLELYEDTAMLTGQTHPEENKDNKQNKEQKEKTPRRWFSDLFPMRMRGLHDVILCAAAEWRAQKRPKEATEHESQEFFARLREKYGANWTKEYREMGDRALWHAALPELMDWGMAERTQDGLIRFLPAFWRFAGRYETKEDREEKQG